MWEKEKQNMREYYLTNGGQVKQTTSKKNKTAANKLLSIPDSYKFDMLHKYLAKCKTEFNICFIEHRLDLNPMNFQPSIYKYIEELKRSLRILEKELFSGVKGPDTLFDWISASSIAAAAATMDRSPNNNDLFSSDGFSSTFTSAVAHASVKKDALTQA